MARGVLALGLAVDLFLGSDLLGQLGMEGLVVEVAGLFVRELC